LSESSFNPRADGQFKVIAESGGRQYYELRAFEIVREGAEAVEMDGDHATYHEKLKMAISLLALARAVTPVGMPAAV
jgi:hypothetical protein